MIALVLLFYALWLVNLNSCSLAYESISCKTEFKCDLVPCVSLHLRSARELFDWIVVKPKPNQLQQPIRNKENTLKNRWVFKVKTTHGKTRATKTWLVLVLHLIGWRDFSWTNHKAKWGKTKEISDYVRHSFKNCASDTRSKNFSIPNWFRNYRNDNTIRET